MPFKLVESDLMQHVAVACALIIVNISLETFLLSEFIMHLIHNSTPFSPTQMWRLYTQHHKKYSLFVVRPLSLSHWILC